MENYMQNSNFVSNGFTFYINVNIRTQTYRNFMKFTEYENIYYYFEIYNLQLVYLV